MWVASAELDETSTVTLTVLLTWIAVGELNEYSAATNGVDGDEEVLGPVGALRISRGLGRRRGDEGFEVEGAMIEVS